MRPIPQIAIDFIADHEALRTKAYLDVAGIPTIGYGHTEGVTLGLVVTKAQARALLAEDLKVAAARLEQRIGAIAEALTVHQYAALLSFVFNVGAGSGWTIWKRLRARAFDQIPAELMKFVNAGGKKVQGLVNRRAEECKLWATEEPGSTAETMPSSVTRAMPTPPTPADPVPPQRSATVLTSATVAVGAVASGGKAVMDAVEPYKDASPIAAQAWAGVATVIAAAAVVALALAWLKKREARR